MRQYLGIGLQFFVLTALPLLIWWQLQFGFALIWMPSLLTVGIVIFWIGTRIRET